MKKHTLIILTLFIFGFAQTQEIPKNQVPPIILNSFSTQFPKATDIEWKKEGDHHIVEFEQSWHVGHEVWYNAFGEKTKHKKEITRKELPSAVYSSIHTDFKKYSVEGAVKVTTANKVYYEVSLDASKKPAWKVIIDAKGNILSKVAD